MAKKINPKKVKRSIKSGLDFSKFYFSKSTSVILITTYSAVLFLALSVLGFSSLILPKSTSDDIPSLPEKEPFAFLPADNIEVPTLGDVDTPEKPAEEDKPKEDKPEEEKPEEPEAPAEKEPETVATPVVTETPVVVVEKEVVKEVVKEVPKEVVKVVEKVVEKEPAKETKQETEKPATEEIHYDNYAAPTDYSSYLDFPDYKNYPDTEE